MALWDAKLDATAVAAGEQLRIENDLVVDYRLYFDMVETLTQFGIMPVPAKP